MVLALESKVSRLRDWNGPVNTFTRNLSEVGIKSFSITRLKLLKDVCSDCSSIRVGIKSFSITRLKRIKMLGWRTIRIWVGIKSFSITRLKPRNRAIFACNHNRVGIKSFSITRLKRTADWEVKWSIIKVGIKSFSITRLKPWKSRAGMKCVEWLESKVSRLRDWNPQINQSCCPTKTLGWNQKFLDYEIETTIKYSRIYTCLVLESKVSRLRDWNAFTVCPQCVCIRLESKVSRLRDWNSKNSTPVTRYTQLLESKVSRLRDWNNAFMCQ